jgi:hypothetical protein
MQPSCWCLWSMGGRVILLVIARQGFGQSSPHVGQVRKLASLFRSVQLVLFCSFLLHVTLPGAVASKVCIPLLNWTVNLCSRGDSTVILIIHSCHSFSIMPSALNLLLLFLAFDWVSAQFSNWAEHQINTTICTWSNLRGTPASALCLRSANIFIAAFIRDTVYLDGGSLWWLPGLDDGTFGGVVNQGQ